MRKAILIDVDGTLIDSNDAHARAWAQALGSVGFHLSAARIRAMIGMGGDKILTRVDPALSDDSEPGRSISRLRERIFLNDYVWTLSPTPGARALLVRLHAEGMRRVVATSAKRTELDALLTTAGVGDQVDLATTSDDVANSKPDPDVVASALHKARAGANEAVYLGDTPYDVEAARRAGIEIIALRCGGWQTADLSGAVAIYDDPADLLVHFADSPLGRSSPK